MDTDVNGKNENARNWEHALLATHAYADMLDAQPPFQIDGNFGGTSGIDECCCKARNANSETPSGIEDKYLIDLLPALPSAWPDSYMHGLRARGGFQVDLDWNAGKLTTAAIRSVGSRTARVRGVTLPLNLSPREEVTLTAPDDKLRTSALHQQR